MQITCAVLRHHPACSGFVLSTVCTGNRGCSVLCSPLSACTQSQQDGKEQLRGSLSPRQQTLALSSPQPPLSRRMEGSVTRAQRAACSALLLCCKHKTQSQKLWKKHCRSPLKAQGQQQQQTKCSLQELKQSPKAFRAAVELPPLPQGFIHWAPKHQALCFFLVDSPPTPP